MHRDAARTPGRRPKLLPAVLVDGMVRTGVSLNDLVSVDDVAAAEIYPDAGGMPVQAGGLGGACGTILLWTKQ